MLRSLAYEEALALQKMFSAENANSRKEDKQQAEERVENVCSDCACKEEAEDRSYTGQEQPLCNAWVGTKPIP